MRRHLPVPRSRRGRHLVVAVGLVVVLGGAAVGAVLSLGTATADRRGLADASFPGFQLSFRYPSAWKRRDWCWTGSSVYPLTLLRTGHSTPQCGQNALFATRTPLPPPQRLGNDGVAVWWLAASRAGSARFEPNTRVAGQPARIMVQRQSTRRTLHSYVNCRTGETQRSLTAQIQGPSSRVKEVQMGAVICGPHFAAGEAAVRRMLASLRFTR